MSSWGKYDNAANTPLWAVNASITKAAPGAAHSAPTRANVTQLFANTAADAYIAGETIGLYGVDANEAVVILAVGIFGVKTNMGDVFADII